MVALPITIPHGYEIQVKVGDEVKVGSILAKQVSPTGSKISLTTALKVPARQVGKYLKVKPGDVVKQGDVLAEKKSLLSQEKILSEVSGEVVGYERDSGELIIKTESEGSSSLEILSPVVGNVKESSGELLVIETEKDILFGSDGIGGSVEGKIVPFIGKNGDVDGSVLFSLDETIIDNILVVGKSDRDILLKAIGMGVKGIITGNVEQSDLTYLMKRNLATPVILVDQDMLKKVTAWGGKQVHMNGQGKTIVLLHL